MTGTVRVPLSRDTVPLRTKATGQDTCCLGGVPVSRCPDRVPFDPSTMVRCADYHAHQRSHHRDGIGWTCDACQVTE